MASPEEQDKNLPVWQREEIFPAKPSHDSFGVRSQKGKALSFANFSGLEAHIRDEKNSAELIWSPERERCFLPEEEPSLLEALRERKQAISQQEWRDYLLRAFVTSLPLFYFAWRGLADGRLVHSQELGFFVVLWLMFGAIPAYEAWKRKRRAISLGTEMLSALAAEIRFELWLVRQQVPVTKVLLGVVVGVYGVQVLSSIFAGGDWLASLWYPTEIWDGNQRLAGLRDAGLIKQEGEIGYLRGEWWRLFTAPMLHGLFLHLVMNGLGLLYLGRRAEVMAGWPHLLLVFVFSMVVGGLASVYGLPGQPSVGASGGVMGLLGFLLAFECLHGKLVPKRATRRLIAALVFTFVVGFVGYNLIDNWAHGGGFLAGLLYGVIVFPKSSSFHRPRADRGDQLLGTLAAFLVVLSAIYATLRIQGLLAG